jgi:hypothetical protein
MEAPQPPARAIWTTLSPRESNGLAMEASYGFALGWQSMKPQ